MNRLGLVVLALLLMGSCVGFVSATSYALTNVIDYTKMTKVDASGIIASVAAGNYTITNDPRNVASYLYYDYLPNYWAGDFTFRTSVYTGSSNSGSIYEIVWAVSNTVGDYGSLVSAGKSEAVALRWSSDWYIYLSSGSTSQNYDGGYTGVWIYIEIARTGSTLTAKIYNNPDFGAGHLLSTLTVSGALTTSWEYLYGFDAFHYATSNGLTSLKAGQMSYISYAPDRMSTEVNNATMVVAALTPIMVMGYIFNNAKNKEKVSLRTILIIIALMAFLGWLFTSWGL